MALYIHTGDKSSITEKIQTRLLSNEKKVPLAGEKWSFQLDVKITYFYLLYLTLRYSCNNEFHAFLEDSDVSWEVIKTTSLKSAMKLNLGRGETKVFTTT